MRNQTLKDFLKYTRKDVDIEITCGRYTLFQGTYEDFKKECKPLFGEFVESWDACDWVYSDGSGKFTQIDISIEGNLLGATWTFTDEEDDTDDIWKKL